MAQDDYAHLAEIALALPEVVEKMSHGAPCFYVRGKKALCYFHSAEFSSDDRISMWCPAGPGVQEELVASDPDRFFSPMPSASGTFRSWLGIYLDLAVPTDWDEVAEIVEDAYRLVAPKKLIADLERSSGRTSSTE